MNTYKYEAVSNSGVAVSGVVEAPDRAAAVQKIKESCTIVNRLTEVKSRDINHIFDSQKINEKNLALVCKQFAIILTAGLPIVQTVELVANQITDRVLKKILTEVAEDVAAGYSIASSFEQRGKKLPSTFIESLRAGEESGHLDTAFGRLSEFYTKKTKVRGKVISALIYPAFTVGVAIIVIGVIMGFAVPTFTKTFTTMGVDLPFVTKLLIVASDFFSNYILVIIGAIALLIVALRIYGKTERGRTNLAAFRLKLPVLGKIQLMGGASQFANTLSTMLSAGLPVVKAIDITGKSISNYLLAKSVLGITVGLESGRRIGECMDGGLFPEMLVKMTAVGEETGSLEETLDVIGEYYDNEVDTATARALSLLEPIIICFLAGFVVLVLLSVYLPMFNLYGNI